MTMVSLGLRSSRSCDSLQQHLHNSLLHVQTTPPFSNRKNAKILKEKENLFHWICKFAGRKKVGMLLLCIIYAAVFGWVLYMGKGEDAMQSMRLNTSSPLSDPDFYWHRNNDDSSFSITWNSLANVDNMAQSLPPPVYFTGYTLPPGNPCETLTLPPPPADKKRTGPRHVKINFSEHFANNLSIEAYVHQAPLNGKPVFPACPVCYLPVEDSIALMPTAPSFSPVLKHLNYIHEDTLTRTEFGGSQFGGYPSLMQRNVSYDIKESMSVHCGFVRGNRPGHQTGFDFDDSDLLAMEECRGIVVASAVFGAYDLINEPKNISETAKKKVCFFMFVDEETEAFFKNSSNWDPKSKKIGLWRTAVVNNLPYADPRRNGKVPKLLLHRLFPNVRYSLWIDAKLELVVDPYQILERFLWRENASFAISRHYKRFDTFIEAEANKAAGKYDNASIDFQADFYRREGLQPYSETKLPITSDVPEGCVIVREHIPITNLFTCLWFNEVDRFTSRDQISFAIVRDKVSAKTNWTINMFLDCERRNFVIQGYHRDVLEHWAPPSPPGSINIVSPPPPVIEVTPNGTTQSILKEDIVANPIKHLPTKRRREKRSGSMRHRKVAAG